MTRPAWLAEVPLAHRGLHGPDAPENTLAAFRAAAAADVGVELDVQRTRDGVLVVVHDHDLRRVAGDPRTVAELRHDELVRVALAGTDERVPTLREALAVLRHVPVMVEVKNPGRAGLVEAAVLDHVRRHDGPVCVAGFNPATIAWFARHAPRVVRVQTAGPLEDVPIPTPIRWSLRTLRWLPLTRPDAVSYELAGLDHAVVQGYRAGGGTLLTWTVRSAADLARARRFADNVIFEDLPVAAVRG